MIAFSHIGWFATVMTNYYYSGSHTWYSFEMKSTATLRFYGSFVIAIKKMYPVMYGVGEVNDEGQLPQEHYLS